MMNKKDLRLKMKSIRASLCIQRIQEAQKELFITLSQEVKKYRCILSFHSILDEISLDLLNQLLSKNKQLVLPTFNGKTYRVSDLCNTIKRFSYFIEPNPLTCEKISLERIDCALIPALAFDKNGHRLGYGKGVYDRLLEKSNLYAIGVGFKEQLVDELPIDAHDQRLDKVLLF